MNLYESFYVKPSANERVETIVHLHSDHRPALFGTVLDPKGKPVEAALVAVYPAADDDPSEKPISSGYTDASGQFAFGPLEPDKLYQIRVFKFSNDVRTLELRE